MGSNIDGRLGISSRSLKHSASPCLVEPLSKMQALKISCGGGHTAALMGNNLSIYKLLIRNRNRRNFYMGKWL